MRHNGWKSAMRRAHSYAQDDLTQLYRYQVRGVRLPNGWSYHVIAVPRG